MQLETEAKVKRWIAIVLAMVATCVVIIYQFHIPIAQELLAVSRGYLFLLLALFCPISFIVFPTIKGQGIKWHDIAMAVASLGIFLYFFLIAYEIGAKAYEAYPPTYLAILAVFAWVLLLEGTRRRFGWIITGIIAVLSIYPFFCEFLPGFLWGKSYSWMRIAGFHMFGPESVLGIPMRAFASYLVGFLLFAAALLALGGGKFFMDFSLAILGHTRGGPAKVSVLASALLASMNGSSVANITTTGAFTIPTMKQAGYQNHYAAAIETCASTAGPLVPPVMGATAFIIAEFLGISFAEVAIAAIVPSVIFYIALFFQVDAYAARNKLVGVPREQCPSLWQTLRWGWVYILPFFLLMYFLFFQRLPVQGAFYSTAFMFVTCFAMKQTRPRWNSLFETFATFGKMMGELAPLLAAVGFIIGSLSLVGTAAALAGGLADLAGGNLALLLLFTALAGYILGMGVTTTAVYVITAVLLAPALVQFGGLNVLAVHLFCMYIGMLCIITPPVAAGAYIAAGMAEAPPLKTAVQSMRMGIMIFIVPFIFILNPALILQGNPLDIIQAVVTTSMGAILLAGALEGALVGIGILRTLPRILFGVAGLCLVAPSGMLELGGIILAAIVIAFLVIQKRAAHPLSTLGNEDRSPP